MIPEGPQAPYFTYGKTVHKVAEEYVRAAGLKTIAEVAKEVLAGDILLEANTPAPPLEGDYIKKFPEHLRHIENLTKKIGFDGHLEYQFKYDLDPPNNRMATGFIDRLIIRGDKYYILDYKTTKKGFWQKNSNTIKKDLQLRVYGKVVQREFGAKAENIKAALLYLEGNSLVSVQFNDEMLETAEQDMLDAYKQIEEMPHEDAYGRVGDQCRRCDYKDICPFYSLT
jgi:CRISPR/Cas system-associated exonuclease Cas4 (RecB family)